MEEIHIGGGHFVNHLGYRSSEKSEKAGKDQESIQSSTILDAEYHIEK